jgi:hypothetical protein
MDDSRSLDPDVIKSKQVLAEIEHSLERMQATSYDLGTVKSISKVLDQHITFIKGMFVLVCFVFLALMFGGSIMWYHMQLDNTRFIGLKEQVDIMNTRQEFLVTWQKQMQDQMIELHKHDTK